MRPHLRLISGTLPSDPSYGRGSAKLLGRGLYAVPLARLSYEYGPFTLPRSLKPLPRITVRDGILYRDRTRSRRRGKGVGRTDRHWGSDRCTRWCRSTTSMLTPMISPCANTARTRPGCRSSPRKSRGCDAPAGRSTSTTISRCRCLSADADIEAELVEGSGIDWLELHLGVTVDGEQVDLVPALVRLIARPEAAELGGASGRQTLRPDAARWPPSVASDVPHPANFAGVAGTLDHRRDR